MAETPKYCTPEFVFKGVTTHPYYLIYLLSLIAVFPAVLFFYYGIYGRFQHGGLALTFGIFILLLSIGMKAFSKTVVIYLDHKALYISVHNRNFRAHPFRNVLGIYSHNYDQRDNARTSIVIVFKNGRKIHLNDSAPFPRRDRKRAQLFKAFLTAAKLRMKLTNQGKNRWREIQGLGAHWYVREI